MEARDDEAYCIGCGRIVPVGMYVPGTGRCIDCQDEDDWREENPDE